MTEYTTSPEAIEVGRNSRDRTVNWVRSHSPYNPHLHSPDSPPSVSGDIEDRDSDDSSHSLPPKMVLRYGGGRADIPISHWHYENRNDPSRHPRPRPNTPYHSHDRARSATDVYPPPHPRYRDRDRPSSHHHAPRHGSLPRAYEDDFSTPPEEIHILPSDPKVQPHRSTGTYRPRRSSEPQRRQPAQAAPLEDEPEVIEPLPPRPPNHVEAPPPVMYSHSQHIHDPYDHQHPSHSHSRGNRPPPSIVYAAGHHHASDHYVPPTIVYAPHKAPGMTYTVSAPTGSGFPQYPRITATPYNPVRSNLSSVQEEPRYGPRAPSRAQTPISDAASGDSGSTYYIIPTPGQKVKVLVGPEPSLYTASSTTKSASSPRSPYSGASSGGGIKKPLFSRLMSFASDLRPSRKILHRRHSLDNSARARSRDR
ncbi:hypothetical protein JVU11DRAFT_1035 [Chiua virens]|nr:hypothetical protein JVU11DRAFT_1035 [Chiua virens]